GGRVESLVDAGKDSAVEKDLEQFLGAHVEFFGEFANGDAFCDLNVARRARLGRCDDRCSPVSGARPLARWMEFALAFHLPVVRDGTLALRRLTRVKRLAGLGLRRHFVRQRRKHSGTPWHPRTGTRAGRDSPGTLTKRTIWPTRTTWTSRAR